MTEKVLKLPDDTYWPEPVWAEKNHICRRTSERHRARNPGLPFLIWAGEIWIGERQGAEYIASFIRQRNPRREQRRRRGQVAA
jgi:hypothetical protein